MTENGDTLWLAFFSGVSEICMQKLQTQFEDKGKKKQDWPGYQVALNVIDFGKHA